MSIECSECERDARGGHDLSCSRFKPITDHEFVTDTFAEEDECVYTELDGERCCGPRHYHIKP